MNTPNTNSIPRLRLLGLILTALALAACSEVSQISLEEYIARAKDYQDQGNLKAAVIELKNALQKAPDSIEARWLLGLAQLDLGNVDDAEASLQRAVELGMDETVVAIPMMNALLLKQDYREILVKTANKQAFAENDQASMWAIRGHALLSLGEFEEADTSYDTALSLDPHSPEANLGKARLSLARGQASDARSRVDILLKKEPESAPGWSLLGDVERYEGNAEAAESAYTLAIGYRHNNTGDLLKRALIRIHLKAYDTAREDIAQLKNRVSRQPVVAYAEGMLNFYQQDYPAAQLAFEQAISYQDNYMPAVFYLGVCHYAQENLEQAKYNLTRFLRTYPQDETAAKLLGSVYIGLGNLDEARSLLEPVLENKPNDLVTLNLLSNIAFSQGDIKSSIKLMQRITSLQPDSADSRTMLGLSLLADGANKLGEEEIQAALGLDQVPDHAAIMLIASHLNAGRYPEAMEQARNLQEKNPDGMAGLRLLGVIYQVSGDDEKAREIYTQILEHSPADPSASYNLAGIELKQGNNERARALYMASLEKNPGHLRILFMLSELETREGDPNASTEWLVKALEANPTEPVARARLARHYLNNGQPQLARRIAEDSDKQDIVNSRLLYVTGDAQIATGNPEQAIKTFQLLVKVQPESAPAHLKLAQAYIADDKTDRARQELAETLRLDPGENRAKIVLSRLMMLAGDVDEANHLLTEVKQDLPESPTVWAHEGWLAAQQNRMVDAVAAYKEAYRLDPSSDSAITLAQAQWSASDRPAAVTTLERWMETHPDDLPIALQLANYYLLLGASEQALSTYTDILGRAPDSVIALNNLSSLLRNHDHARAKAYAERAMELSPETPPIMDTLGLILLDEGNTKRALELFRSASEKFPENPNYRYHLAQALIHDGYSAEAKRILTALLESGQSFPEEKQARAMLESLAARP